MSDEKISVVLSARDDASKTVEGLRGRLSGLARDAKSSILTGVGLGVGASAFSALQGAASSAIQAAGDAARAASSLQQSTGAVASVFGDAAGEIETFGRSAANSLGLSRNQVNEMAAVLGAQLKGMGFSATEAAEQVKLLQQRGADMAATFGGTTADAVQAISALMRGERDPIERYGVSIRAADVEARILALGLDTTTTATRKTAEATAGLQLLMESTASSMGQFARESDELAGSQQRLQAKIENANAEVGKSVASIQLGAIKVAEAADAAMTRFAVTFGEQSKAVELSAAELGVSVESLRDKIGASMIESGLSFEEASAVAESALLEMKAAAWNTYQGVSEAAAEGMRAAVAATQSGASEAAAIIPYEIRARYGEIRAAAYEGVVQLAVGLLDAQNAPKVAMEALARIQEESMTRTEEIAFLHGQAATLNTANGLLSTTSSVRLAAQGVAAEINYRLEQLGAEAYDWGAHTGNTYAAGLSSSYSAVRTAAGTVASAARGILAIRSEPTDPSSPLRGITEWGGNIVKTIADDMRDELGEARSAARALAGELVPMSGSAANAFGAVGGMRPTNGGGGSTHAHHTHIYLNGREIAKAIEPELHYMRPSRGLLPS